MPKKDTLTKEEFIARGGPDFDNPRVAENLMKLGSTYRSFVKKVESSRCKSRGRAVRKFIS